MNAQPTTLRARVVEKALKALRFSMLGCIVIAAAGFSANIARAAGAIGQYADNGVYCSPASQMGEMNRVFVQAPRLSSSPVATNSGGIVVGVGGGTITTGSMSLHQQWVAYRADLYQWNSYLNRYVLVQYGRWYGAVFSGQFNSQASWIDMANGQSVYGGTTFTVSSYGSHGYYTVFMNYYWYADSLAPAGSAGAWVQSYDGRYSPCAF